MTIIRERDDHGQGVLEQYDWTNGQIATMDGTAKTPALPSGCAAALVTNTGAATVYARGDGTAAVAQARQTVPILAGTWRSVPCPGGLSLIGASGDVYVMPLKSAPS